MANDVGGGPAYPQHGWSKDPEVVARMQAMQGMTLWDAYAMAYGARWTLDADSDARYVRVREHAKAAAEYADAMMIERDKRGIGS